MSSENSLVPSTGAPQISTNNRLAFSECVEYAKMLAECGYFKDADTMSKAFAKIVAGQELGIEPMQAMSGIHIISGKPSLSAGLLANLVQRSGWANYRVVESNEKVCTIDFIVNGLANEAKFTIEEAKSSGFLTGTNKANWEKYPSDMLFARCMTRGIRRFCPAVVGGPAYTPEELSENEQPERVKQVKRGATNKNDAYNVLKGLDADAKNTLKAAFIGKFGGSSVPAVKEMSEEQAKWVADYKIPTTINQPTEPPTENAAPEDDPGAMYPD